MSTGKIGLTRAEMFYCIVVTITGITLIALLFALKMRPHFLWPIRFIGVVLLTMLPIGIIIEVIQHRWPRVPVAACFAITTYAWCVFVSWLMGNGTL